jgi:hypothetical protein
VLVTLLATAVACADPAPSAEAPESAGQEKTAMTPSTTNADDVRHVVQMTIDLDSLEKYFHFELPGRRPLCIVKNDVLARELQLEKSGAPVRFLSAADAQTTGAACLEFSKVEIREDSATVEFAYRVEGIHGSAEFSKASGTWRVVRHQLRER